jgi:elongation factor P--beta-lysine ligase
MRWAHILGIFLANSFQDVKDVKEVGRFHAEKEREKKREPPRPVNKDHCFKAPKIFVIF